MAFQIGRHLLGPASLAVVLGMSVALPSTAESVQRKGGKKPPAKQTKAAAVIVFKPFHVDGDYIVLNGLALIGKPGDFKVARAGQWIKLSGFDTEANNGVFRIGSVSVDGSALNLVPGTPTVFEPALTGRVRSIASSAAPTKAAVIKPVDNGIGKEPAKEDPGAPKVEPIPDVEKVPPFAVTGDHLWLNGLALMGHVGDFKNARAGQWVKVSGFETASNNGIFLIESVDPTGSAINLDARSGAVYEAVVAGKPRTIARSEPPDENTQKPVVEPTKTEPPKTEPPKTEPPKTDPPKVDPPKVDPPKVDPPKTDPPKKDPPKEDPPKVDAPAKAGSTKIGDDPKTPVQDQPKVTNVAVDSDMRSFLKEIASQTGTTIIPDETITESTISIEFANEPIESALEKLTLMVGAYWKKKGPGFYLISKATPKSSLFREFATTRMYVPKNQTAATISSVLSLVFKEYVAVDPKMNMIGVTAPEPLMNRIMADVKLADSPSKQILVEALVAEMTTEDGEDYGFSWSWKNFSIGGDLGINYAKASFADIAKLKSLIDNRKATLMANPRLTAFEGRDAVFTVGQETYYSLLTGNSNFPYQQIQLIKTGITMKFTGFVDDDGTITLNLDPEVSDAVVAVNGNPTTNVRRASTSVRVKPGETIVIAGLSQHSTDRRVMRVPILGSIPILGELFKQTKSTKKKTDVIMMITPILTDRGVELTGDLKNFVAPLKKSGG